MRACRYSVTYLCPLCRGPLPSKAPGQIQPPVSRRLGRDLCFACGAAEPENAQPACGQCDRVMQPGDRVGRCRYGFEYVCEACCTAQHEDLDRPIMTPRDAALAHYRVYQRRGDGYDNTRAGHMGHRDHGLDIDQWEPLHVTVKMLGGLECNARFAIRDLWDELEAEQAGKAIKQLAMF